MKKLFQLLMILFVLALATSVWSAGAIKTFQLKAYDATTSYTGYDDPLSGATMAPSGVSDMTWTGGPGKLDAWPNTTDKRTFDLNDLLDEGMTIDQIVFFPTGVTLERSVRDTTFNVGLWKFGVKFAPVDDAAIWARARTYYAGPQTTTGSKDTEALAGGVTGYATNSATSNYAYPVMPLLLTGNSDYVREPLPVQRYMRATITAGAGAGVQIRNPEAWMTIIPH